MSRRLIPWCLALTGFVATLSVFTWQGKQGSAGQGQLQAAGHSLTPPANDHYGLWASQDPAASEAPQSVPATMILPLPSATQIEPDANAEPVPDDQPTVDDLPARRSPPESPEDE